MSSAAKVSIIIGVVSFSQFIHGQPAFAQGRFGGRGGRDENRPMSNEEITQRLSRTADFLKKIDANGNGMIDPDEANDPNAKNMLDRIFGRMGKEQHYPMAISEILQGYEAYYRARGSNGGGSTSPGGSPPSGTAPAAGWTSPPGMGFGPPAASASGLTPAALSGGSSNSSASRPAISSVSSAAGSTLTVPPPSSAQQRLRKLRPHCRPRPPRRLFAPSRRIAGHVIPCGCQAGATKAGPFPYCPRAIAQRTTGLVPGKGRQWQRANHHGRVHRQLDAGKAGGVCPL